MLRRTRRGHHPCQRKCNSTRAPHTTTVRQTLRGALRGPHVGARARERARVRPRSLVTAIVVHTHSITTPRRTIKVHRQVARGTDQPRGPARTSSPTPASRIRLCSCSPCRSTSLSPMRSHPPKRLRNTTRHRRSRRSRPRPPPVAAPPQPSAAQRGADFPPPGTRPDTPPPQGHKPVLHAAAPRNGASAGSHAQAHGASTLCVKSCSRGVSGSWHGDSGAGSDGGRDDEHSGGSAHEEDSDEEGAGVEPVASDEARHDDAEPVKVRARAKPGSSPCTTRPRACRNAFVLPTNELELRRLPMRRLAQLLASLGTRLTVHAGAGERARDAAEEGDAAAAGAARTAGAPGDHPAQTEQSAGAAALPPKTQAAGVSRSHSLLLRKPTSMRSTAPVQLVAPARHLNEIRNRPG